MMMMKKITLLTALAASSLLLNAQTFTDDFESYQSGNKLGPLSTQWTTWSGTEGGAEDVTIVNDDANSGSNSIYFSSTSATGGPQDVVLLLGGVHNTGQLDFDSYFKIPSGKSAYFNFQANATIGQVWALDIAFDPNGVVQFKTNTGAVLLESNYPANAWFKLGIHINLNTNNWEVFINNNAIGSFASTVNQVASIDFFPANAQASFWIDDVSFVRTSYTLPTLNAAVTEVQVPNGLAGMQKSPSVVVRNLGTTAINSFDIAVNYNGATINQSVTGVNIASLGFYTVNLTGSLALIAGSNNVTATVSNVNGMATDGDANDNSKILSINPLVPSPGKVVVGEEATGTWCQWCPRGAVFMDRLTNDYGNYFAGIAVHNNDPMEFTPYDDGIGPLITGYPSAIVDRNPSLDPSEMDIDFRQRIVVAPKATILNGASWDANTRELKVSLKTTFSQNISGNYKIACVLTQDDVTGTGSGYAQSNSYAGGNNGPMGGYESLPNPVPASQMVYDHVARVITPSFGGLNNAFGTQNAGAFSVHTFTFILPTNWETDKMHIVGLFIEPSGKIDNAGYSTIQEAITNGFVEGIEVVSTSEIFDAPDGMKLMPNPASAFTYLQIDLKQNQNVAIEIYSATGALMMQKNYGELNGMNNLPIHTSQLSNGIYFIRLQSGEKMNVLKLMVNN